ncbi:sel1 repeat family protein, partial [Streptomyces sp. SID625]|nr:sel1 repeat family protein [Streptomyces sp. SID625]
MDVMGDKVTLFETGRFVQTSDPGPTQGAEESGSADPYRTGSRVPCAEVTGTDGTEDGTRGGTAARETAADETGAAAEEVAELARRRLAAESGDTEAMSVLGAMLLRRGDLDGAEPHLRAATAAGDRAAANNLGVLLQQRGYPEEAAGWWRIAAVAGSAPAAHALGRHHRERG